MSATKKCGVHWECPMGKNWGSRVHAPEKPKQKQRPNKGLVRVRAGFPGRGNARTKAQRPEKGRMLRSGNRKRSLSG